MDTALTCSWRNICYNFAVARIIHVFKKNDVILTYSPWSSTENFHSAVSFYVEIDANYAHKQTMSTLILFLKISKTQLPFKDSITVIYLLDILNYTKPVDNNSLYQTYIYIVLSPTKTMPKEVGISKLIKYRKFTTLLLICWLREGENLYGNMLNLYIKMTKLLF